MRLIVDTIFAIILIPSFIYTMCDAVTRIKGLIQLICGE